MIALNSSIIKASYIDYTGIISLKSEFVKTFKTENVLYPFENLVLFLNTNYGVENFSNKWFIRKYKHILKNQHSFKYISFERIKNTDEVLSDSAFPKELKKIILYNLDKFTKTNLVK